MAALKIPAALILLLILLTVPATDAGADDVPDGPPGEAVTLAVVPGGITVRDLDRIRPAAIGLMNPGLGDVPAKQTWLDVSQGARVFDNKYARDLGPLNPGRDRVYGWSRVLERARSAGLPIRPGLLATALAQAGLTAGATERTDLPAIAAARRTGSLRRTGPECPGPRCELALTVTETSLDGAAALARQRSGRELLIVIEAAPARSGDQLAIAIAGPGFRGMLQSPSTRTDGYLLATDIAPTVLTHFRLPVPGAMTGLPVQSGGEIDYAHLQELEGRYEQVGKRRGAALAVPLLLWAVIVAGVILASRGRMARPAVSLLCLAVILLPVVLLFTAAISPSLAVERAIATVLPVAVAIGLLRRVPGYGALAWACALTVIPYGIDMLAGSVLTPRAVIGPNPGLGARFYGIGNELESTLMILTSVGVGAGLTAIAAGRTRFDRKTAARAFIAAGIVATVTFAAGRFGADVGAAIVFPVAAVVGATLALGRPRLAWLAGLAALGALVAVALVDLTTGGETHFLRSVLGGGSGESFGDVLRHRLEATGESFTRTSRIPVTVSAFLLIALAIRKRTVISGWLAPVPYVGAGVVAAAAGSVIGAATNDSGVLFIQVGVLYLGLVLGFVWATGRKWG